MTKILDIKNFCVSIEGKKIIKNVSLIIKKGQIHAIMGPNGSGKSSFAYALMGHPSYIISSKKCNFFEYDLNKLSPEKRARFGMFLAFQNPYEIPGASIFSVLKEVYSAITSKIVSVSTFTDILLKGMNDLKIDPSFVHRGLNEGFSGGEKKRLEILQMLILRPKLVVLDEIDSGLDIDSIKVVAKVIIKAKEENPDMSLIIITHHRNILQYLEPDFVHVMHDGEIVKSGNSCLSKQIEETGYNEFNNV